MVRGKVLGDGAREEEDEDDGGGDPERPVEVRVPVQDVKEGGVREREEGGEAAVQDGAGVDGEKLGVEGEGPEVAFGGYGPGIGGGWGIVGGGGKFGRVGGGVVKVCGQGSALRKRVKTEVAVELYWRSGTRGLLVGRYDRGRPGRIVSCERWKWAGRTYTS